MNTITGLLIDVINGSVTVKTVDKNIYAYYDLIQCDVIDIVGRKLGDRLYLFICDDEGLLKDNVKITAINSLGQPMLVGNLFIVNDDGEDDLSSLTEDDIAYISQYIHMRQTFKDPPLHPILHHVEFF